MCCPRWSSSGTGIGAVGAGLVVLALVVTLALLRPERAERRERGRAIYLT
jgi:hypothetical protein